MTENIYEAIYSFMLALSGYAKQGATGTMLKGSTTRLDDQQES